MVPQEEQSEMLAVSKSVCVPFFNMYLLLGIHLQLRQEMNLL